MGRLYVANTAGVLTFDGTTWDLVQTANESIARSVAVDSQNRVYVGAQEEIGRLVRDDAGTLHYRSLTRQVPEAARDFSDVWRTMATSEAVYFLSFERLLRWNPSTKTMRTWTPAESFGMANVVRDTLFVQDRGQGLHAVVGNTLQPVAPGASFGDAMVRTVLPHGSAGLLVGTGDGLFERTNGQFRPFRTEADSLLADAWVYSGTTLPDGTIALGTIGDGMIVLGPEGTLLRHRSARGKPVTSLHAGPQGGLWALLDGGIQRYGTEMPLTRLGQAQGLKGRLEAIERHRGTLHVGTNLGIFQMQGRAGTAASFRRLTDPLGHLQTWALFSTPRELLVGTHKGVWVGQREQPARRIEGIKGHVYDLLQDPDDPDRVYAVGDGGLYVLEKQSNGWQLAAHPEASCYRMRSLLQPRPGMLWAGRTYEGTVRIRLNEGGQVVSAEQFGVEHGLPKGGAVPQSLGDSTVFSTNEGLHRFVPSTSAADSAQFVRIHPLPTQDALRGRSPDVQREVHVRRDGQGRLWGRVAGVPGRWTSTDADTLAWRSGPLRLLYDEDVDPMLLEKKGRVLWLGGREGLVRYRQPGQRRSAPVQAYVRQIRTLRADSLIGLTARRPETAPPSVDYAQNSVRIRYAAPSYHAADPLQFQYRLLGYSDVWSDWTTEAAKDYTNLGPGLYTFEGRALNAFAETSTVGRASFRVAPPWYRRWWAYGGYVLVLLGLVAGAVRWRTRRLQRQKEELEATVEERTEEVRRQRDRLEQQAEELKELDAAKSRFFANVSHEFRTPLTLLLGPLEQLRDAAVERGAQGEQEQIDLMQRNIHRLRRLINQVLDLAELDAGQLTLNARPVALADEVARMAQAFAPLAERQAVDLQLDTETKPDDEPPVVVDPEQLEHVVSNLLSNALTFTPEALCASGPTPTRASSRSPTRGRAFPRTSATISSAASPRRTTRTSATWRARASASRS